MSTILVVDDEADTRYVVRQVLEKKGFDVVEAGDGTECLEKLKSVVPDLVLLDIMMPGLDGWEVLAEMQSDRGLRSVPVTMFTVKPLTPKVLRKKEIEGLVNYIVKPFSKEGLVKNISETLESISASKVHGDELKGIDPELGEEYDEVSKMLILHKNFLSVFSSVLKQRKEDGSLDDIQSFEDVLRSEFLLVDSYSKKKEELEARLLQG